MESSDLWRKNLWNLSGLPRQAFRSPDNAQTTQEKYMELFAILVHCLCRRQQALLISFRMFYGTLISKFNKTLEQTAMFLKYRIVGYQLEIVF